MKRYFYVYAQLVKFALKQMLTYRANAIALSLFFPAWQLALFGIVVIMFNHTDTLAGWSRPEAIMLYLVCEIFLALTYFVFFEGGARYFMDKTVRYGELDFILTKPMNTQFLSMFSRPSISPLLSIIVLVTLFFWYSSTSGLTITPLSWMLFALTLIFSFMIVYFVTATYVTISFYTAQARQMVEIIDKATEYAQYPLDAFAQPVRLFLLTILPIFFFGNVSANFLLGKGNLGLLALSVVGTVVSYFINQRAWALGLKRYSSASS